MISQPTFALDLHTVETPRLESLLDGWHWILANPDWAEWHEYAEKFIPEMESELYRRSQTPSPV